jgi:oxaloacetate decarboxylase alpha subunit/pyruvate carboxylase subunit B
LQPQVAFRLVSELKKKVGLPIVLHSHDTAGLAAASYLAAVEAGVDAIEVAIVPFANGTSQPDANRMWAMLEGHPRCPDFDRQGTHALHPQLQQLYKDLAAFTSPANERVDSDILIYQVPGGMLSNFRNQLKEQGMSDKFEAVLKEIPVAREALGWIPLVTPTSQIVGTQAMMNVKFGRWKNICQPAMDIALGKYGRTPGPIDPFVLKEVERQTGKKPITERPADLLPPGMEKLKADLRAKALPDDDETAVLYGMFPQQVESLLKPKPATSAAAPAGAPSALAASAASAAGQAPAPGAPGSPANGKKLYLTVNGRRHEVTVETLS